MTSEQNAQLLWSIFAIVLVASSLFARRLPVAQWLKMALAWVGIFGVMFILSLFRDEAVMVWNRAKAEITGQAETMSNGEVRIRRDDSGHFRVRAKVNGADILFLVDTGATVTAISASAAQSAGLEPSSMFPVLVETANGTVQSQRTRIARLEIGSIVREDAPAHISPSLGDMNLLGMSFLETLSSWRMEGDTLILKS
jgi:aspartyl protease family protein